MEWLGLGTLGVALLIFRGLILGRWRRYQLSHRQAAALWASATPALLVVLFVIRGLDGPGVVLLCGLAVVTFVCTYAIAVYFLRAFGGEMDPPTSSGYRRRP